MVLLLSSSGPLRSSSAAARPLGRECGDSALAPDRQRCPGECSRSAPAGRTANSGLRIALMPRADRSSLRPQPPASLAARALAEAVPDRCTSDLQDSDDRRQRAAPAGGQVRHRRLGRQGAGGLGTACGLHGALDPCGARPASSPALAWYATASLQSFARRIGSQQRSAELDARLGRAACKAQGMNHESEECFWRMARGRIRLREKCMRLVV